MNPPANTPVKTRFPHAAALAVANQLCAVLSPYCERLSIAGSIRRMKPDVGDVEIVFVPKTCRQQVDLLAWREVSMADLAIDRMVATGILAQRRSKIGTVAWGDKNKLAVHSSGIPVDLFATSESCWYNYLVCRTGPAALNARIATAAQAKGWKWNPYGPGFTHSATGHVASMDSEEAVFDFVGIPFLQPSQRLS